METVAPLNSDMSVFELAVFMVLLIQELSSDFKAFVCRCCLVCSAYQQIKLSFAFGFYMEVNDPRNYAHSV